MRSTIPLFTSFSNTLLTSEKRLTGWQFLAIDLSPTLLSTGTNDETFQQSGKQNSFRHILERSASIYKSSGSQFFRTTTGIQSGPDAFAESKFVMSFSTIFEVMEIYSVSNQFQKGEKVKGYPSHQDKSYQKSFQQTTFLYQMQKTTPPGFKIEELQQI